MNDIELDRIRSVLVEAIDRHVAKGGSLIRHGFRYDDMNMCPVACATYGTVSRNSISWDHALDSKVGFTVSTGDFWDFIDGFDNANIVVDSDTAMSRLGIELRDKYKSHIV